MFRSVGQIDQLKQVELGVVTESCCGISSRVPALQDGELAAIELGGFLAGAVGDPHREQWRGVIKNGDDQRGSVGLGRGLMFSGK